MGYIPKKGMSIEKCIERASRIIDTQGMCLLLFDVKGSSKMNAIYLNDYLTEMVADFNKRFSEYLPANSLAVIDRQEKGFQYILGDSSWAAINSADMIVQISTYQKKNYPDIELYWSVAKDGYDREGVKVVR